jgi:hypothetical protein
MIELTLALWLREYPGMLSVSPHIFAINLPAPNLYPAVKISRLFSKNGQTFDGLNDEEDAKIQIDYWADNPDTLKKIKKKITEFFNGLTNNQTSVLTVNSLREQPSYEPKDNIYKQTLELNLSYKNV